MQELAEGVRRAGKVDGRAVAHALRTGDPVSTVFGPVTFDAKGDAEGMTYEMNVWHAGRYGKLPEASQRHTSVNRSAAVAGCDGRRDPATNRAQPNWSASSIEPILNFDRLL
jgi:hypothetical protein